VGKELERQHPGHMKSIKKRKKMEGAVKKRGEGG
jgi:hypothetical protein